MNRSILNKDFGAGLLFLAISIAFAVLAQKYDLGTPRRMGAAFFPTMVAALLGIFAIVLIVRGVVAKAEPLALLDPRPAVLILGSAAVFMLLLRPLGLPIAIVLLVLVASAASRRGNWGQMTLLALGLALGSTLVFRFGLGQSLPVCGSLFAEALCPAIWS